MTVRIWLEHAHLGALRIGGWSWLRHDAQGLRGMAGGERTVDAERQALAVFSDVLAELPDGAAVELASASPLILAIPSRIARASAGQDAPDDNLDLWAKASVQLNRLSLTVRPAKPAPNTPVAFTAAWAERACDHARAKGRFASPIPKPNLAKAGV